jgi:hypothetical protein
MLFGAWIAPDCCGEDGGGLFTIISPPMFVVADKGEVNIIAIPIVNAIAIPKIKEAFLEFIFSLHEL